ncbi:GIY-YIG nuclease family protein [Terrisporobacter mayombei]|uniref:UvrABC system protein C n=1 Tax=Terrisporobacter mayombei TaxID=1541 RepID=A0ABY9PYJ0_9FIRM|nr:GIY-YIG nuclease family protein [Terrisporobacter mayombei]MCC3868627.1 GIY-YIG nuclease family protein [Terrisporobacter mayombei]WMT80783.1 UvrABC system protein C [Terrisporobacter mayombei]
MNLKDKIEKMPECPGIYIMKDAYNNIIYVGKSINLKSRVKSYFRENLNRSRKIERMVKSINDIDYITTDTELDALLLECDYIHNIRPMYNTLMNNYEKYKYIKLNTNNLNLIDIVDEKDEDCTYFGPFSMNKRLFTLRDFLLDYFKLPTCNTKTKCIRYNIEKCVGPCRVNTKEKYEEIYKILVNTFEGKDDFIKELENEMITQSSLLNFEKAMEIKSNIELLKSISQKQNTFDLFKNNCKFVLWMKMNENNYKLYFINNVKVEYSQIINKEEFDEKKKSEIIQRIEKFKLNKNNKVVYDKSYIDYINIIYSYIHKSEKIDYIQI